MDVSEYIQHEMYMCVLVMVLTCVEMGNGRCNGNVDEWNE